MSILIKGMDIDEPGEHVFSLHRYHDGTMSVIGWHRYYRGEPFQAIKLPPHGRLIDADAADDYAYDELEISYSYLSPREASRNMQLLYRNMPTIIEAEDGEG